MDRRQAILAMIASTGLPLEVAEQKPVYVLRLKKPVDPQAMNAIRENLELATREYGIKFVLLPEYIEVM